MDLILWRHAEAEEGSASLPDHKRRLTPAGEKQASQMAEWLKRQLPKKTRILVSPAQRTQQTATALGLAFETEPQVSTGADVDDHLKTANWPDANGAVLVVGHQPTLGRLAATLLAGRDDYWSVKKGGVWWFSSRRRNGDLQVVLRAVVNPDML